MTDKQINLKLPDALWYAAKVKAAQNRMSLSAAIRLLLGEWVASDRGAPADYRANVHAGRHSLE